MLSPDFSVVLIIFMCRHCGHIEKVTKENRDEKLMEHLMDYCDENLMDRLDDTKYLEKIESEVNNYVNLYAMMTLISIDSCSSLCFLELYIYFLKN